MTYAGTEIGSRTLRSFFVEAEARDSGWSADTLDLPVQLSTRMRLTTSTQRVAPCLNNETDIVRGDFAPTGLEFSASAAIDDGCADVPLQNASLRPNSMRPFIAGQHSLWVRC